MLVVGDSESPSQGQRYLSLSDRKNVLLDLSSKATA